MPDSTLSAAERALLHEFDRRGVRFLVVGMSAALLHGARGATEDIDLWFEDPSDPRIAEAVRAAGGFWISGAFGGGPAIGGEELSERFDVVWRLDGLEPFDVEFRDACYQDVDGILLPVLPLHRIIASKQAAGRAKDRAALESLQDALTILEHGTEED